MWCKLHIYQRLPSPSNGFSKCSGGIILCRRDRSQRASVRDENFSGHPCPEIAGCERNIKKISFSCERQRLIFVQLTIINMHILDLENGNECCQELSEGTG